MLERVQNSVMKVHVSLNIASTLNAKPRFGASSIKTHAGSGVSCSSCFLFYNTYVGST